MNRHIKAIVYLVNWTNADYFAKLPIGSFPTILTVGEESFSSQVLIRKDTEIKPASEFEIEFQFLVPDEAFKRLVVGTEFSIWEQKFVGKGRVIEIIAK